MLALLLQWKLRLSIPISPTTLHPITAKPDLQNRAQTSKRKSPNLRTRVLSHIFCFPGSTRLGVQSDGFKTYTQKHCLHTQIQERTHRAHTHKTAASHWAELRYLERAAVQPKLKNLLVSPTLKGGWGAEFETTLEHMSYWSDQSKQWCRHTNTFYLSHGGRWWNRDNTWVILAFVCSSKLLLRQ